MENIRYYNSDTEVLVTEEKFTKEEIAGLSNEVDETIQHEDGR